MAKLYLIVLAVVLIAVAALVHADRRQALQEARQRLHFLVQEMADQQDHVVDLGLQLARMVAADPRLKTADRATCDALLAEVQRDLGDHLAGLALVSPQGEIVCAAPRVEAGVSVADPPALRRALQSSGPLLGEVLQSQWLHQPVIPVYMAVGAADQPQRPVLKLALDQHWLQQALALLPVPGPLTVGLMRRDGVVAARFPDSQGWTGRSAAQTPMFQAMASAAFSGVSEGQGLEGVAKVHAFAPFGKRSNGLTVWISAPAEAVVAAAGDIALIIGATLMLLLTGVLTLLWRATDRLVLQPAAAMAEVARRLGSGDLSARVGLGDQSGEMATLAAQFDAMAASLARMDHVVRANRALEVLAAVRGSSDAHDSAAALCRAICQHIVETGGYLHAWVAREDLARPADPSALELVGRFPEPPAAGDGDRLLRRAPAQVAGAVGRALAEQRPVIEAWIAQAGDGAGPPGAAFSTLVLPLGSDATHRGVLAICAAGDDAFGASEQTLLGQLAGDVAQRLEVLRARQERRRAQDAVTTLSQLLERAEELTDSASWRIDLQQGLFSASKGYYRLLGTTPTKVGSSAIHFREHIHPDDAGRAHQNFAAAMAQNAAGIDDAYRIVTEQGEVRHVIVQYVFERDANGAPATLLGAMRDVTKLRQAEAELRKLSLVVEQSPSPVVITDLNAQIEYVNDAFVRTTGYERAEILGKNPRLLKSGQTDAAVFAQMWQRLKAGEVWTGELYNRKKDGTLFIEHAAIMPLHQPDGSISHYVAIKDDVTERKRMAEELEHHRNHLEEQVARRTAELAEAQQRAEAANLAKSRFLANMSHEIRTPMNAIIGLTHLLRQAQPSPAQDERLIKIERSAQHLLSIINDVLDLSKIEAGKLAVEESVFDLDETLRDVIDNLADRARDKGLLFAVERGSEVPGRVSGDALRLSQILLNLGTNAVKFTPRGSVTLRLSAQPVGAGRVLLRFEVADTGIGLSEAEINRLFKAFEQADVSTTRRYGGTGLGLAISRRLVQLLGGEIGVHSEPGAGSTFWFTANVGLAEPTLATAPRPPLATQAVATSRRPGDVRILLVEDDAFNQEVATDLLRSAGFAVDVADNGAAALQRTQQARYDLVLMDLQMPVMDGLTAARQMRQRAATRVTPILAMTASAFAEDRRDCMAAGMNDFVAKPIQPEAFFAAVCDWTGASLDGDDPAPPSAGGPTDVAAPRPPEPPSDGARLSALLRQLPLDSAAGLLVVRGDVPAYLRLLRRFCQDQPQISAALQQAFAQRQWPALQRTAHTLKATAGTIGATEVQAAAQQLDSALSAAPTDAAALERLVQRTLQDLHALTVALAAALPADAEAAQGGPVDRAALGQVLAELLELARDDDTRAVSSLGAHAALLRQGLGAAPARAIERALEEYDFSLAVELLAAAQAGLAAGD